MDLNDASVETIVDLGCGTGAAGAAWAVLLPKPAVLTGVDIHPWAVSETNWSWRTLGLEGRARRGDVVRTCVRLRERSRRSSLGGTGIVLAWTVNELSDDARRALLPALLDLAREGASVLVIEPIARRVAPWWDEWEATFGEARGVAREWPACIRVANGATQSWAALDREAGFQREALSARCLCVRGAERPKG
jgi:hypothetical protein